VQTKPTFFRSLQLACAASLLLTFIGVGSPVFSEEMAGRKVVVQATDMAIPCALPEEAADHSALS
jgi:hypothetical protein